jgi:hypothetical protein
MLLSDDLAPKRESLKRFSPGLRVNDTSRIEFPIGEPHGGQP